MAVTGKKDGGEKLIGTNPTARQNYFIDEVLEAGIMLTGTEIKSLRAASPNLRDAYVDVVSTKTGSLEAWLVNAHIAPYVHGNIWNHEPLRKRKLLLHRIQIDRMFGAVRRDGISIVAMRIYLKGGRAKIELGMGKGKKKSDKRQSLKEKSAKLEMDQARKRRRD